MLTETSSKHSRDAEPVQITKLAAEEQTRRIQSAIARRAYEIFVSRGSAPWHELEDWQTAEQQLLITACHGRTMLGANLWLGTSISRFCEGSIGIWVAPRQLTIFGKPRAAKKSAPDKPGALPPVETLFRVIPLPVEIDPASVSARIRGLSLEIVASKAPAHSHPVAA
ncbi:MAG TPA: DUF2934 domain-containing protein [Candidatus Acidoferrum sp.]|nr:DUF2934 domain-containing protein [Candidatus Acidoferrum sp.]